MNKKLKFRYSLAAVLFAFLVFAVFMAEATQPAWHWVTHLITFTIIQVIAFGGCVEVLTRNIPSALAKAQSRNCVRQDGTWSKQREKMEVKSVNKLRTELLKAFLVVAMCMNVLLVFVHYEIVPIPLAVEAMTSFDVSEFEWKANLRDEESRFDTWVGHSLSNEELAARKRLLWNSWPLVVGIGVVLAMFAFAFIGRAYWHGLKELSASIKYRSEQHRLRELHASVGHDDFAKPDRRRRKMGRPLDGSANERNVVHRPR